MTINLIITFSQNKETVVSVSCGKRGKIYCVHFIQQPSKFQVHCSITPFSIRKKGKTIQEKVGFYVNQLYFTHRHLKYTYSLRKFYPNQILYSNISNLFFNLLYYIRPMVECISAHESFFVYFKIYFKTI